MEQQKCHKRQENCKVAAIISSKQYSLFLLPCTLIRLPLIFEIKSFCFSFTFYILIVCQTWVECEKSINRINHSRGVGRKNETNSFYFVSLRYISRNCLCTLNFLSVFFFFFTKNWAKIIWNAVCIAISCGAIANKNGAKLGVWTVEKWNQKYNELFMKPRIQTKIHTKKRERKNHW